MRESEQMHYFGRGSAISSDGQDTLSWAFRKAAIGFQTGGGDEWLETVQAAVVEHMKKEVEYADGEFPGFQEPNHLQGNTALPLKDDLMKICPSEYTAGTFKEHLTNMIVNTYILSHPYPFDSLFRQTTREVRECTGNNLGKKPWNTLIHQESCRP